jgi:hypothetical protein
MREKLRKERKHVLALRADIRVNLTVRQPEVNAAEHVGAVLAVNVVMPIWGPRGAGI